MHVSADKAKARARGQEHTRSALRSNAVRTEEERVGRPRLGEVGLERHGHQEAEHDLQIASLRDQEMTKNARL